MTQLREEVYFTKGRVIVRGKTVTRGEKRKVDYLLFYKPNLPIAIVEAKDNNHTVGAGMEQAIAYAESLDVPFAFSSNGDAFLEHDRTAASGTVEREIPLDQFPSPEDLWARYRAAKGYTGEQEAMRKKAAVMVKAISTEFPGMILQLLFFSPSSVSLVDSSISSSAPYAARFSPLCSCSTIRRPISKLVITCRVLTTEAAPRRAAWMRARTSATSGARPSPLGLALTLAGTVRLDELMALVDELEAQLVASRATAANLLSAVVSELTTAGGSEDPPLRPVQ